MWKELEYFAVNDYYKTINIEGKMQYFSTKYLNLFFQDHFLSILLPLLVFDIQ